MPEWYMAEVDECVCCKERKPVKKMEVRVNNILKILQTCYACTKKLGLI